MACTGHCNQCIYHAGYIGPRPLTSWTDPTLSTNIYVKSTHFNQLRTAIIKELSVRSRGVSGMYGVMDTNDRVYGIHYRRLRDNARRLYPTGWTTYNSTYKTNMGYGTLSPGNLIQDESTTALRAWVNYNESLCVCNCNYSCTCNCNYGGTCLTLVGGS